MFHVFRMHEIKLKHNTGAWKLTYIRKIIFFNENIIGVICHWCYSKLLINLSFHPKTVFNLSRDTLYTRICHSICYATFIKRVVATFCPVTPMTFSNTIDIFFAHFCRMTHLCQYSRSRQSRSRISRIIA